MKISLLWIFTVVLFQTKIMKTSKEDNHLIYRKFTKKRKLVNKRHIPPPNTITVTYYVWSIMAPNKMLFIDLVITGDSLDFLHFPNYYNQKLLAV